MKNFFRDWLAPKVEQPQPLTKFQEINNAVSPLRFYGDGGTIHSSGTIDIVLDKGKVVEVWFRCQELPFRVSDPKGHPVYEVRSHNFQNKDYPLPDIHGVVVRDKDR